MSSTELTPSYSMQTQAWGYNGHHYLRSINLSSVTPFNGQNWSKWNASLLSAIMQYQFAFPVLTGSVADALVTHDLIIRGLEHDLYEIIIRTISCEVIELVHEYIAVKSHPMERRGSTVYSLLHEFYCGESLSATIERFLRDWPLQEADGDIVMVDSEKLNSIKTLQDYDDRMDIDLELS